jgi:hypothetical protein
LRRGLSEAGLAGDSVNGATGSDSRTAGTGASTGDVFFPAVTRVARFFGSVSKGCSPPVCAISVALSPLERPLSGGVNAVSVAGMFPVSVDLDAAFTLVLGEAPEAALRFLTGFPARGGEGSLLSEKVGSVMCCWKGGEKIGLTAVPRLLWRPWIQRLREVGGPRSYRLVCEKCTCI